MKKIEFWGRDQQDERLLDEVLDQKKTATCTPKVWYDSLPKEEKCSVGDLVEVFTKKGVHKATICITDIYEIPFGKIEGEIGERIAKGENSSLEEFIDDHIFCWDEPLKEQGIQLKGDTRIVVEHFELVSIVENS